MTEHEIMISRISVEERLPRCGAEGCENPRVDPTERCWNHLTIEEREGVRAYVVDHREALERAQLVGADLSRLDLRGASLDRAWLIDANLDEANLSEARLRKAQLLGASAQGTSLELAKCNWINLSGASLRGANLRRAVLAACHAHETDFSGANLEHVLAPNADFTSASFEGSNLMHAHLESSSFKFTRARTADLRWANLQFTQFARSDLRHADISYTRVYGMSAWDCSTEGIVAHGLQKALDARHPGLLPAFLTHTEASEERYSLKLRCATGRIDAIPSLLEAVHGVYAHESSWGNEAPSPLRLNHAKEGSLELYFVAEVLANPAAVHLGLFSVIVFLSGGLSALVLRSAMEKAAEDTTRRAPSRSSSMETRGLVDELAVIASDPETAKMIARRADFPAEHLPDFKTAIGFWTNIIDQIVGGRGDLQKLVDEAIRQFPANQNLLPYRDQTPATPGVADGDRGRDTTPAPPDSLAARNDDPLTLARVEPEPLPERDLHGGITTPTLEQELAALERVADTLGRLRERGYPVGNDDERRVVERVLAVCEKWVPHVDPRLKPLSGEAILERATADAHAVLRTDGVGSLELVFVKRMAEMPSGSSLDDRAQ